MRPLPLRTRLTIVYTGILALVVTGLAVGYHRALVGELDRASTTALDDVTRGLHGYLHFEDGVPVLSYNHDDPEAVVFIEQATRYYQVFDARSGRLLVQSPSLRSMGLHYTPAEVAAFRASPGEHEVQTAAGRLRISSSLIQVDPDGLYLLQVGEPLDRLDRAVAEFERVLVWRIGGGLLMAGLVGWWLAGRALAPMSSLAAATRTVGIDNLGHRLPVRGANDELDEVAESFNQALDRLEHAVREMRQFSAALAHELRTPLAVLRGEAELALTRPRSPEDLRQQLGSQIDEFDRLARLINQILTLAKAEAGEIVLAREPVDLAGLAETVVDQFQGVAEARGVTLDCRADKGVVVTGDRGWLERLLLILLDNGVKYTPAGGHVSLALAPDAGQAVLDVVDTGPGIPPESRPHLFEPFYRADPSRSRQTEGAGLGLALAKWVVETHQGSIDVISDAGRGSTFRIRLSLASSRSTRE